MKVGNEKPFRKNSFSDEDEIGTQLTDECLTAIVEAYKYHLRMEVFWSNYGAMKFSPKELVAAHYHRTVKDTLEAILKMLITPFDGYYLGQFNEGFLAVDAPDISLILKPEPSKD